MARCSECGTALSYNSQKEVSGLCQICFNVASGIARRKSGPGEEKREYHRIHYQLRTQFGKATEYDCVDCGKQARHWSHVHYTDHTDIENYEPRCISCHRVYDGAGRWNIIHGRYSKYKDQNQ